MKTKTSRKVEKLLARIQKCDQLGSMSPSTTLHPNLEANAVMASGKAELQMGSHVSLLIILDPSEALNADASERSLQEIAVMMDKKWKIHLICSKPIHYKSLSCEFQVHSIGNWVSPDSIFSRVLYLLFSVFKGVSVVRKHDVHVVMAKEGHLQLGMVALSIKKLTNRKCIIRVNEDDVLALLLFLKRLKTPVLKNPLFSKTIEQIARWLENYVFKLADRVITHGPTDFNRISKITNRIDFVPLYVDTHKFRPMGKSESNQARKELLQLENNEKKVVLFVGRLHPEKDIETLLFGFKKLFDIRKDVVLVVVGEGPEEEKWKQLANKLGLSTGVKFMGYIPHDSMPKFYTVADIYVLTSIWEELSNTIMEAMACGIPVIATAVGGNPYLVKDGETGFLVPSQNPGALSEKIAYALDHPEETEKKAAKALLNIQQFRKQLIGERYKEIIIKLISPNRS